MLGLHYSLNYHNKKEMHQAELFNQVIISKAHYKSNYISKTLMGDGIGVMQHYFSMDNSRGKESKMYKTKSNSTGLINSNAYCRKLNFSRN